LPLVALATVLFAVTPAQADIIFSDFGPGYGFYTGAGWLISGVNSSWGLNTVAMDFTPGATYTLTQIDVAVGWDSGTNGVTLSLNDSVSGLPGVALETWNLTGLLRDGVAIDTVTPLTRINLVAGTQYWIVAAGLSDTMAGWSWNDIGETGNLAADLGSSGWRSYSGMRQGAFDVLGSSSSSSSTPEPAAALCAAAGLGLFAIFRRKRK